MIGPEQVAVAVGAVAILGALATFVRWLRPRSRSVSRTLVAIRDTFLGREAISDSITGREIEPAQPAIGVRMAKLEETVTTIAEQQRRLDNHEDRIVGLERARNERAITQLESAAMFNMVDRLHEVDPARPDPPEPA